jgi:hypothetical protein
MYLTILLLPSAIKLPPVVDYNIMSNISTFRTLIAFEAKPLYWERMSKGIEFVT